MAVREPISVTLPKEWVSSFNELIYYLHRAQGGGDYGDTPRSVEHSSPDGFKTVYYVLYRLSLDLFPFPCETAIAGKDVRTLQQALQDMRRILQDEKIKYYSPRSSAWWKENQDDEDAPRIALNLLEDNLLSCDPEARRGV